MTNNEFKPEITAVMRQMSSDGYRRALAASGVPKPSWELAFGDDVWLSSDRSSVRYALDAAIFAVCDFAGLPRTGISAEFLAGFAVISVSPANWMGFSHFYSNAVAVSEYINTDGDSDPNAPVFRPGIGAERLFALITAYANAEDNEGALAKVKEDMLSTLGVELD